MHKALIIGIASQDGSYLAELLLSKKYTVIGTVRGKQDDMTNVESIQEQIELESADLLNPDTIFRVIEKHKPDELYNLAALTVPSASWQTTFDTGRVNGMGPIIGLEAVRQHSPHTRFFQASSREMFGDVNTDTVNENTPINPSNPYAAAKAYAHFMTKIYRRQGLYTVSGIMFNHESPRRPLSFVTRKITAAAASIKLKLNKSPLDPSGKPILNNEGMLELWDLTSFRDRGHAKDFVSAMWLSLQVDKPDDYIIATGQTHSVEDVCRLAFNQVGLDWKEHTRLAPGANTKPDTKGVKGDYSKIKALGWKPEISFDSLIAEMVEADLKRFSPLTAKPSI
jgi:GDPmannose 4,6-dehydratase